MREYLTPAISSVVFLILALLGYASILWFTDITIDRQVDSITYEFNSTVTKQGYIDEVTYNGFLKQLEAYGKPMTVKLLHGNLVYEPLATPDAQGNVTRKVFMKFDQSAIFDSIYNKKAKYQMHVGDDFSVEVICNSRSALASFVRVEYYAIHSRYGGMIKNE